MKKPVLKIVSLVVTCCLFAISSALLLAQLPKTLGNNQQQEVYATATIKDYNSFASSYNASSYSFSTKQGVNNTPISEENGESVVLGYKTKLDGNDNSQTEVNVLERINTIGNLEDYIKVNEYVYGNVAYNDENKVETVSLNNNYISYDYDENNKITSFINNNQIYDYTYENGLLTKITKEDELYAEYTYNQYGKLTTEKYPLIKKWYEHTNVATMEYQYDAETNTKILAKIYDYVNTTPYVINFTEIENEGTKYNVPTKIIKGENQVEFEYNYFYNDVAYITQVKDNGNVYNLTYINDKLLTKTTATEKTTFVYSSTWQLVGAVVGKVDDLGEYNEVFLTFVTDPFNNVVELNYLDYQAVDGGYTLSLEKVYEQQFNSYGSRTLFKKYDTQINLNIGYNCDLMLDNVSLVYENGNLYSTISGDYIKKQNQSSLQTRSFVQFDTTRNSPMLETVVHNVATEALQNEIQLQLQTSSIGGMKIYNNEYCVGIADVFTLPVLVDEKNMLKQPSQLYFLADGTNQGQIDYYKNFLQTYFNKDTDSFVQLDEHYIATAGNQKLEFQFVYKSKLYTVSYLQDGLYTYTAKNTYSSRDFLEKKNVINYDTGRFARYYVSTLDTDNYISDFAVITNFSSMEELNAFFEELGMISTSAGQTINNIDFGDNSDYIKTFLSNTYRMNLPDYNSETQYLDIDDSGNYIVKEIPPDAIRDTRDIAKEIADAKEREEKTKSGIWKIISGAMFVVSGVVLTIVSCGAFAIVCGVIATTAGVVMAICGVAQIVEAQTGRSWIVENILGGKSELLDTISSIASTVATIALIAGSIATSIKGCFVEGTQIATLNGTANIEDIKVGDYVLSYDTATDTNVYSKVIDTYKKQTNTLCEITYDKTKTTATPNHPFFVEGQWKKAEQLEIGDNLLLQNGETAIVESIKTVATSNTNVYNFNVEQTHNYYANNVLVHNKCADFSKYTTKEQNKLASSQEFKDAISTVKSNNPKINFDNKKAAARFWNSKKGRYAFNKELGNNIGKSTNMELKDLISNIDQVIDGKNPIINITQNINGKLVTTPQQIQYHHLFGKTGGNMFELYPMTKSTHMSFHNDFGRHDPSKWFDFAKYVLKVIK